MVLVLTEDALVVCAHELGKVALVPTQSWVTIESRRVLVQPDPEQKGIGGCPNIGPTIKSCQSTMGVRQGYSTWVRIDGRPLVLASLEGVTDGTPPGLVNYNVNDPGETFVSESA